MFLTKGKRLPGIVHPGSGFQGQKNGRVVPPHGKDQGTGLGSVDCAGGPSLFGLKKNFNGSYHRAKFNEYNLAKQAAGQDYPNTNPGWPRLPQTTRSGHPESPS